MTCVLVHVCARECMCYLAVSKINIISRRDIAVHFYIRQISLGCSLLKGMQINDKLESIQRKVSRLGGNGNQTRKQPKELEAQRIGILGNLFEFK